MLNLMDEEGCFFGVASPDRCLNANAMLPIYCTTAQTFKNVSSSANLIVKRDLIVPMRGSNHTKGLIISVKAGTHSSL